MKTNIELEAELGRRTLEILREVEPDDLGWRGGAGRADMSIEQSQWVEAQTMAAALETIERKAQALGLLGDEPLRAAELSATEACQRVVDAAQKSARDVVQQ